MLEVLLFTRRVEFNKKTAPCGVKLWKNLGRLVKNHEG
jgi:hypothetical protein